MAILNITMPEGSTVCNGKQVTFRAPCDSSKVTGIKINGIVYDLLDTENRPMSSKAFITNAMVSVIIDTDNSKAYMQTNGLRLDDNASDKDKQEFLATLNEIGVNAENLRVSEETNSIYGIYGGSIDNVLNWLGKYNQHWWKKIKETYQITETPLTEQLIFKSASSSSSLWTYSYCDNLTLSSNGEFITHNLVEENTSYGSITSDMINSLKGKYIKPSIESGIYADSNIWYYLDSTAVIEKDILDWDNDDENEYCLVVTSGATEIGREYTKDSSFVASSSRNGYIDGYNSGDSCTYQYIGIPYENMTDIPKISYGKYYGTGNSGSADSPISLTFSFKPNLVFVIGNNSDRNGMIMIRDMTEFTGFGTFYSTTGTVHTTSSGIVWGDKTVGWYSVSGTDADKQNADHNILGQVYYYFAIGE